MDTNFDIKQETSSDEATPMFTTFAAPKTPAKSAEGGAVMAILTRIEGGELSLAEACTLLGMHRSTLWRKLNRVRREGAQGLRHRLAGRPSNRRLPDDLRAQAIALYREVVLTRGVPVAEFYRDLADKHGISASYATLTRWLRSAGLTTQAPRRRERIAGETVVVFAMTLGSARVLIAADAATGRALGMSSVAGVAGVKQALATMLERHGLPQRITIAGELLADLTPPERRSMKFLCERLGVSLATTLPRHASLDMLCTAAQKLADSAEALAVAVANEPAAAGETAFLQLTNDGWRKVLA